MSNALNIPVRRDPATLSPREVCKGAFGPFCANLRRLKILSPTQKDIGVLVAKATLKRGFTFFYLSSLAQLTQVYPKTAPFAGLGKNDLSPGLAALASFGILKLEEKNALEAGAFPATVLTVFADVQQWSVRASDWAYTLEDERRLAEHWEACSRQFTPALAELGESADLHDARAAVSAESAAARLIRPTVDAREVRPDVIRSASAPRRSDSQNAKTPANTRSVPAFGTRLTITSESESGSEILPIGSDIAVPDLKIAVAEGDEREFCAAARQIMGAKDWDDGRAAHWQGEGSKWRMRHRDPKSRRTVRSVFLDMIEHAQSGGATAEYRWKQFGGTTLDNARLAEATS